MQGVAEHHGVGQNASRGQGEAGHLHDEPVVAAPGNQAPDDARDGGGHGLACAG